MDTTLTTAAAARWSFAAITVSALALASLLWLAPRLGLMDHPGGRKKHQGSVPLIGGLSVLCGLLASALWADDFNAFNLSLLLSAAVLSVMGAIDDRGSLGVRARVLVQVVVVVAMALATGVHIGYLGDLWGLDVRLGWLGIPFTVVAMIGLLNAFNLMDGIDGLASLLGIVAVGGILVSAGGITRHDTNMFLGLLVAAMLPQLLCNLGLFGTRAKCFLGDAGSTLIGYVIGWALIERSQAPGATLSPVATLWCVAIPVFDTLSVMLRRIRIGMSPFQPGRRHIHYMLMDAGLGPGLTLFVLVAVAIALWAIGAGVRMAHLGSGTNLAAFCVIFVLYFAASSRMETWLRAQGKFNTSVSNTGAAAVAPPLAAENQPTEPVAK